MPLPIFHSAPTIISSTGYACMHVTTRGFDRDGQQVWMSRQQMPEGSGYKLARHEAFGLLRHYYDRNQPHVRIDSVEVQCDGPDGQRNWMLVTEDGTFYAN